VLNTLGGNRVQYSLDKSLSFSPFQATAIGTVYFPSKGIIPDRLSPIPKDTGVFSKGPSSSQGSSQGLSANQALNQDA
jgi:hypothetical protein